MAIGWLERGIGPDGKNGGWYRGMSTFVFDSAGLISGYEGSVNLEAIRKAYAQLSQ
jgi:hypothetical protein